MKLTKSTLKRLIKEEIQNFLRENKVTSVEPTSIEGAEAQMPPNLRVNTFAPKTKPSNEEDYQIYNVTLGDGGKIIAQVYDGELELYDLEDQRIQNKDLEAQVLKMIE